MKGTLLASGALLALIISPLASAQVDIYGEAHMALNWLDDGDEYSAVNLSSNLSRIGFRTESVFSPHIRGVAQLEGMVDLSSDQNLSLTSRDSYLGLTGYWGTARAGYFDTPNKELRTRTDLFLNQLGDTRNVLRGDYLAGQQGFDERFRNSIAYRTPTLNGFRAEIHYSAETVEEDDAADGNRNDAVSGSVTFEMGHIYGAMSHERWNFAEDLAREDRHVSRLAVGFNMGALRLVGLAQQASSPSDRGYSLGALYQFTPQISFRSQFTWLDADDSDFNAQQLALGADYQYARALRFYANYVYLDNSEEQTLAPWREGSTLNQPGAADETAHGIAVGAILSF